MKAAIFLDPLPHEVEELPDQGRDRGVPLGQDPMQQGLIPAQHVLGDALDQRMLRAEGVEHRRAGHPRRRGDLGHGDLLRAPLCEELTRDLEDPGALVGAALSLGSRHLDESLK